jgi:hypothetical protein
VKHKILRCLLTGYKEHVVILGVAKEVLNQSYPTKLFDIVVIAD